jgi:hypothetical protein
MNCHNYNKSDRAIDKGDSTVHIARLRGAAALIGLLSVFIWQPASAALITESLGVEIVFGPATGETGTIDVSYDTDDITGVGDEILGASDFSLELMLFGQTFTEANDLDFPGFPELSFADGVIVFIDYIISETDLFNPTPIDDPRIDGIAGGEVSGGAWLASTFAGVPEPTTPALLLVGLLGWLVSRQRLRAAEL